MSREAMMSRTFSLRSLIVVVTALCVLAGIAVNFPGLFFSLIILAGYAAPATIMSLLFTAFSSHRIATALVTGLASLFGGGVGAVLFSSDIRAYYAPPSLWTLYFDDWLPITCCSTIAAFLAGVFLLQLFSSEKRERPTADPLQDE